MATKRRRFSAQFKAPRPRSATPHYRHLLREEGVGWQPTEYTLTYPGLSNRPEPRPWNHAQGT